jgi:hypothetical protein
MRDEHDAQRHPHDGPGPRRIGAEEKVEDIVHGILRVVNGVRSRTARRPGVYTMVKGHPRGVPFFPFVIKGHPRGVPLFPFVIKGHPRGVPLFPSIIPIRPLVVSLALALVLVRGVAAVEMLGEITVEPTMVKGASTAPVTIVEFSDYQ